MATQLCPPFPAKQTGGGETIVPPGLDPDTGVLSKDVTIDDAVSARLFLPPSHDENGKLPVLLYFHGGGFCQGSGKNEKYHHWLNTLSFEATLLAVSVDYRLARNRRHRLPAAYDDSWTALNWVFSGGDRWLAKHGDMERVFVAGDSAGANITHNLAMRIGGYEGSRTRIEGVVLLHPYFWGAEPVEGESDPEFRLRIDMKWTYVIPCCMELDDPRINPMAERAPSLAGLGCRRALVCVAEKDVYVRGRIYNEELKESGWKGKQEDLFDSKGVGHDFFLDAAEHEAQTKKLIARLIAFLSNSKYLAVE